MCTSYVLTESGVLIFSCNCLRLYLCWYHAIAMYVFSLWLCWFVDFYLVRCMAVLNVFICVAAPYLVVSHCGYA
jgi:hypothetical protein